MFLNKNFDKNTKINLPFRSKQMLNKEFIQTVIDKSKKYEKLDKNLNEKICSCLEIIKGSIDKLWEGLKSIPKDDEFYTIVHNDINHTNVLVDEKNKVYIIDYDMISKGFFFYDLAIITFSLEIKSDLKNMQFNFENDITDFFDKIADAYLKERPIKMSKEKLIKMIKYHELFFLVIFSLMSHMLSMNQDKNPLSKISLLLMVRYLEKIKQLDKYQIN